MTFIKGPWEEASLCPSLLPRRVPPDTGGRRTLGMQAVRRGGTHPLGGQDNLGVLKNHRAHPPRVPVSRTRLTPHLHPQLYVAARPSFLGPAAPLMAPGEKREVFRLNRLKLLVQKR